MKHAAAFFAESFPFVNELLTTRLRLIVLLGAGLVLAVNLAAFGLELAGSRDYVTPHGQIAGGDFVVFDAAADAAAAGEAAAIYDADEFSARLGEKFPARGALRLSWQYPPTMFLLIAPLAPAPYFASYFLWAVAGAALFFFAMRRIAWSGAALFAAIAAPAAFQALITGQTGFFTAALLVIAAAFADRRWLLAGAAAGLLTVKPQLGILLPFAFAAAGCWRAFGAAAATAALFAAASYAVFGPDVWNAFIGAVTEHSGRLQSDIFPYEKLISIFGAAVMLGVPVKIALGVQLAATVSLAGFVALVWRRVKASDLRVAILCAAAPLATPYAFYYEMTLAIPVLLIVARRCIDEGWLPGERAALAILWLAPMFVLALGPALPWASLATLGALALAARRVMNARFSISPVAA